MSPGALRGHLINSELRWVQGAPGRPGSAVAGDRVLHLPVLPLPARDDTATAAGPAGRAWAEQLRPPVARPRPGWRAWRPARR